MNCKILWDGNECKKNQGNENLQTSSPLQIMVDQKQLENAEYFSYLGSMITNDAKCTHEIKSGIGMEKAAFNRKKTIFISKLGLSLRKKLVKWRIWSIALYGAET
jgi:hypothetical protein